MSRVIVISDTHAPFTHPLYLEFCERIRDKWGTDKVVHIGDEVDNHAISFHDAEPDAFSADDEGRRAQDELQRWFKSFPVAKVCLGNHTRLPERQAKSIGLSSRFLKSYRDAWHAPRGWSWELDWYIDGVRYTHGHLSGKNAHTNLAERSRQSTVIGHTHCFGGVQYMAARHDLIFGMNVGCGIDVAAYAFRYGKDYANRPTLGCGVVIDGVEAYFEPMLFKNRSLRRPQISITAKKKERMRRAKK